MSASQSSSARSVPAAPGTPTLLYSTSSDPWSACTRSASDFSASRSRTSITSARALPPAPSIAPTTSLAAPSSTSTTITWAPSAANASAAARPMPEPPAVMSAVLFFSSMTKTPIYLRWSTVDVPAPRGRSGPRRARDARKRPLDVFDLEELGETVLPEFAADTAAAGTAPRCVGAHPGAAVDRHRARAQTFGHRHRLVQRAEDVGGGAVRRGVGDPHRIVHIGVRQGDRDRGEQFGLRDRRVDVDPGEDRRI